MNAPTDTDTVNRRDLQRRFDRAANTFDSADFVHTHARDSLLERLEPVVVDARTVVDLGCATGQASRALSKRYRGAHLISVDLSREMLRAHSRPRWFAKRSAVQADATAMPFADHSVDVVFCNLMLPCVGNPDAVFAEVSRILSKGGVFAFSTLGPDSLLELRRAWRQADEGEHTFRFADMHDVGDGLVRAGLADPVLDVDRLTVSYASAENLFADLSATGARNSLANRNNTLCGKGRFRRMTAALEKQKSGSRFELGFELVYAHCWGRGQIAAADGYRIDANNIGLRRR
jgi:malonyl-CoA O-methyltransferase